MSEHERHPLVQALAVTGRLPRAEIAAAVAHIAEVTPDLLAAVEHAAAQKLDDEAEGNLVFFALHILAAAREPRLHGPLMRLLHRPNDEIEKLLGDVETDSLDAMIVGVFDGQAGDLFDLARDAGRNEYLRSSVMSAIAILTWEGRIDAVKTREFLERFDEERVIKPGDIAWYSWSKIVEKLGWEDMVPRVEQAYADDRIWEEFSSVEHFRESLAETLQAAPDDGTRLRRGGRVLYRRCARGTRSLSFRSGGRTACAAVATASTSAAAASGNAGAGTHAAAGAHRAHPNAPCGAQRSVSLRQR